MAEPAPAPAPARRSRPQRLARVVCTEQVTPHMIRIVFGGEGLQGFGAGEFSDHYVKLQVPPLGADYVAPFDAEDIKARLPREHWPRTRTYTVRAWDPERTELTIDFVVHGDEGVAGPWAANAQPGDALQLSGPGGAYAPDPDAAWHLMVGDPSVIPAISASLARIPAGVEVHVLIEVEGPDDEQPLATPGELHLRWVHGGPGAVVPVLEEHAFPEGAVHAFVHGEAGTVRAVRRHLLVDRAIPREALSVSGYWKQTRTEEGWREDKAEWNRLVEEDVAATG
ncbi:MAG TPA: siderophore-interacting protein [Baekduia sp.]|nr:siderophore-interacting protein [Baekduia sp.]